MPSWKRGKPGAFTEDIHTLKNQENQEKKRFLTLYALVPFHKTHCCSYKTGIEGAQDKISRFQDQYIISYTFHANRIFVIHAKVFPKVIKFVWQIVQHPSKRYFSSIQFQIKRLNIEQPPILSIIKMKKIWFRKGGCVVT